MPLESKNTQNHENWRLGLTESLHMQHCCLKPKYLFQLTAPRRFLCCNCSLYVRRWFHMWRLLYYSFFLISPSFDAPWSLFIVIVAFSELFLYVFHVSNKNNHFSVHQDVWKYLWFCSNGEFTILFLQYVFFFYWPFQDGPSVAVLRICSSVVSCDIWFFFMCSLSLLSFFCFVVVKSPVYFHILWSRGCRIYELETLQADWTNGLCIPRQT